MNSLNGYNARPVSGLDKLEWLSREALWGVMKLPLLGQWELWEENLSVEDSATVTGMVIGSNLGRAETFIKEVPNARDANARTFLFSRAAEHIGKMAGGLINTAAHFRIPRDDWGMPFAKLIPLYVELTAEVLVGAERAISSLDPKEYYAELNLALPPTPVGLGELEILAVTTQALAERGVATWLDFMGQHEALSITAGGTPRSGGEVINRLQTTFFEHMSLIEDEVDRYRV